MTKSNLSNNRAKISAAALALAAKGWDKVTLAAVAKAAKLPLAEVQKIAKSPHDLAPVIAAEIDREAFAPLGKMTGTAHDILFDVIMARFDVLQKHRAAILNMADAARADRALACALSRATMAGAYRLIDVARLTDPPRPVLALGLTTIYGWAFWAWRRDDSRDMAKTMAALDRGLKWADKAIKLIKPNS